MAIEPLLCKANGNGSKDNFFRPMVYDTMLSGETLTVISTSNGICEVEMDVSDSRFDDGAIEGVWQFDESATTLDATRETHFRNITIQNGWDDEMLALKMGTTVGNLSTTIQAIAEQDVLTTLQDIASQVIIYYVAVDGDDGNAGTDIGAPLATLDVALDKAKLADSGTDDVVIYLRGGSVYRQGGAHLTGVTNIRVLISNYPGEDVIFSGSDIVTDWALVDGETDVYQMEWLNTWGEASNPYVGATPEPSGLTLRRELFVANDKLFLPVASEGALIADTFFVDEGNSRIRVKTALDLTDTVSNVAEIAVRGELIRLENSDCITLRGITVKHSSNGIASSNGASTVLNNVKRLTVSCDFLQNSGDGCIIYGYLDLSEYVNLINCNFNENGLTGCTATTINNMTAINCQSLYNTWRGNLSGYDDWSVAGLKWLRMRNAIILRWISKFNYSRGIWFDYDNKNTSIIDCISSQNLCDGAFIEANFEWTEIIRCIFAENGWLGVRIHNSHGVTIDACEILRNTIAEVGTHKTNSRVVQNRIDMMDYTLYHNDITITNSIIEASELSVVPLTVFGSNVPAVDQRLIYTFLYSATNSLFATLSLSNNSYYRPVSVGNELLFKALYASTEHRNLADWQTYDALGLDVGSTISTI